MNGGKILFLSLTVLTVLLVGCTSPMDSFARCLTESGTTMFGAWWCPHCADQKEKFGKSFKEVLYVECSMPDRRPTPICIEEGIDAYPTWEFPDGSRDTRVFELEELAQRSGCQLP